MSDPTETPPLHPEEEKQTTTSGPSTTKQLVIDELLQHLQKCMREKSDLLIRNEVLQSKLQSEYIEKERLNKSCSWYRSQLHETQERLRVRTVSQSESRKDYAAVHVQLLKSQSECDILRQRLSLEQSKECVHHERHLSHDSSGIFSESTSSETSEETAAVVEPEPLSLPPESTLATEDAPVLRQLTLERDKALAECEMWRQQCQLNATLLEVHKKSVHQLQGQLLSANEAIASKRGQVDELIRGNEEIHGESMRLLKRFEEMECQLRANDSRRQVETCEKGVQSEASHNYCRSLLRVVERECQHKLGQREVAMRTLVRKLKDEMRRGKEHEGKHKQLQADVSMIIQALRHEHPELPAVLQGEKGIRDQLQKVLTHFIIIPREDMASIAQVKEECERYLEQLDKLKTNLRTKEISLELATDTIEVLKKEQDMLKQKIQGMDNAASDVQTLLRRSKEERDEVMCQNEELNKAIRGLLLASQERRPRTMTNANDILKRCANYDRTVGSVNLVSEGIRALQEEVKSLNCAILFGGSAGLSLLDELQAAV